MSKVNYEKILIQFASKHVKAEVDGKPITGLHYLHSVAEEIQAMVVGLDKVDRAFADANMGKVFLDCPDCGSPTLLEFNTCKVCGTELMGAQPIETTKQETKPEPQPAKEVAVKPAKAKKEKKEKVVAKEAEVVPITKAAEKPVTTKQTKVEVRALPSKKEIDESDVAGLKALVTKYGLTTNSKGFKVVSEYRNAIREEVEALRATPEKATEEVTPTKSETPVQSKGKVGKAKTNATKVAGTNSGTGVADVPTLATGAKTVAEVVDEEPLVEKDSEFGFDDADTPEEVIGSEDEGDEDDLDFNLDDVDDLDDGTDDSNSDFEETENENWE